ncbi:tRNA pseudouridine(13) synthase TruD [Haloarchaeobius salinus]|uniref:tRNA pseudouridine(13) synthase TruD n=1 Tax=Haloarchaeobius salinus TaxID=1198298 RepID=UPI00210D1DD8|nr:tRNA pseudouridine(13) synthase TruD [Haloarchaeobius salinus]
MREAHPRERAVGIEHYVSDDDGVGGRLRAEDEHFHVVERERFETNPVDAPTGDYPYLVVRATLRGWDTNDFVRRLSNELGMSRGRVSWAGTKDKRAVSTQLFTLQDVDPDDLPSLSRAALEIVGRAGRALQFGDLLGNEFEIVVSDPDDSTAADRVTTELREFGDGQVAVPNFFGQQRFGSIRPVTHEVGLDIVRGDWEAAVRTYVGNPHPDEREETREARELVDDGAAWADALEAFPGGLRFERSMLHTLVENGGEEPADFREAIETLPENLQRLFVHAAQSYAFNLMLSRRLERGVPFTKPVAGDVVCFADADAPEAFPLPDVDREQRVTERRVDTVSRHCERGRAFVTAPLVGTETELADGEQGEIERDVLSELSLSPSDFDLPGEFHSTGTRRAVLVGTALDVVQEPLTFSFSLPKGSYATVLLREYLKVDPVELG